MKIRESGMPEEELWTGFFDPPAVLDALGLRRDCGDVVEFGCGYGTFTIPAAQRVSGTVYALDIEPEMIAITRAKAQAAGLRNVRPMLRDFVADGTGLPDDSAGYAMLFNILHAEDPVCLLKEAYRVLAPGGILAIMHWNYDPTTPRGPSLDIRPTPRQCQEWAESAGYVLLPPGRIDLPPYHHGLVLQKPMNEDHTPLQGSSPASTMAADSEVLPLGVRLRELAVLFLRIGFTAFGGPAAHIAIFEDEVVRRRRWLTHERFLDLLGVTNLIPGPNSTEMVIHIGYVRAGPAGMIVAGLAFILPASCIVGVCAWLYVRYGSLPSAEGILYGVKPVVIAIIAQALWGLGKKAAKTRWLAVLAGATAGAVLLGLSELAALVLAGAFTAVATGIRAGARQHKTGLTALTVGALVILMIIVLVPAWRASGENPFSLTALFLFFLKVGSVLYGSGYVLLAFIQSGLVQQWQWITERQLLDAVAVGQVTPGPLFTTATFIGFLLAGVTGAAVATLGIFLPSFVFVGISGPIIPRMRRSVLARAFLDGVNAASLALMTVVTLHLGWGSLRDPLSIGIALVCAILLYRFRVNSTWLILAGGLIGLIHAAL